MKSNGNNTAATNQTAWQLATGNWERHEKQRQQYGGDKPNGLATGKWQLATGNGMKSNGNNTAATNQTAWQLANGNWQLGTA